MKKMKKRELWASIFSLLIRIDESLFIIAQDILERKEKEARSFKKLVNNSTNEKDKRWNL